MPSIYIYTFIIFIISTSMISQILEINSDQIFPFLPKLGLFCLPLAIRFGLYQTFAISSVEVFLWFCQGWEAVLMTGNLKVIIEYQQSWWVEWLLENSQIKRVEPDGRTITIVLQICCPQVELILISLQNQVKRYKLNDEWASLKVNRKKTETRKKKKKMGKNQRWQGWGKDEMQLKCLKMISINVRYWFINNITVYNDVSVFFSQQLIQKRQVDARNAGLIHFQRDNQKMLTIGYKLKSIWSWINNQALICSIDSEIICNWIMKWFRVI